MTWRAGGAFSVARTATPHARASPDLDTGVLVVSHTLTRGSRKLAEPKTQRGRRGARLGPDALQALRDHRDRQALATGRRRKTEDYVFTTPQGRPLDTRHVTRGFQAALERAGLPRQRFHDLRHAFATLMIEDGEDLAVVSRILGHADLRTTADTYAHLTSRMSERAASRMDAIVRRGRERIAL